jgi:hypothetical protein
LISRVKKSSEGNLQGNSHAYLRPIRDVSRPLGRHFSSLRSPLLALKSAFSPIQCSPSAAFSAFEARIAEIDVDVSFDQVANLGGSVPQCWRTPPITRSGRPKRL